MTSLIQRKRLKKSQCKMLAKRDRTAIAKIKMEMVKASLNKAMVKTDKMVKIKVKVQKI